MNSPRTRSPINLRPLVDCLSGAVEYLAVRLARQRSTWRSVGYMMVWLLLMVATLPVLQWMKPLDWKLLQALDARMQHWPDQVAVVDIDWNLDPATTESFRDDLAQTIDALARMDRPPAMLVLDMALSRTQSRNNAQGIVSSPPPLRMALDRLRTRGVKVFQAASIVGLPSGLSKDDMLEYQSRSELHGVDGVVYGHANFGYGDSQVTYRPCELIRNINSDLLIQRIMPALPTYLAYRVRYPDGAETLCDQEALERVFIPGDRNLYLSALWHWDRVGRRLVSGPAGLYRDPACNPCSAPSSADIDSMATHYFDKKIVVLGNLAHDQVGSWSGPILLGWAIGDALGLRASPSLLRHPMWAFCMAMLFSALTLAFFFMMRRYDFCARYLTTALVVTVFMALLTLTLVALGLRFGLPAELQAAYFQVSYVIIGVVITALLAWHATRSAIRERALYTNISGNTPEIEPIFDVFISYSHTPLSNFRRVQTVVKLLEQLTTSDGRTLRVFVDRRQSSIRVGTWWYIRLAEEIERSRCVVALYTKDYFYKPFCRFELQKAIVRDIANQRRNFRVLPFKLEVDAEPPPEFNHIQYMETSDPNEIRRFVQGALAEVGVLTVDFEDAV